MVANNMRRIATVVAALPLALLAMVLIVKVFPHTKTVTMLSRDYPRSTLIAQQQRVRRARTSMLDEEGEEGDEGGDDCVSWRGCIERYDPETMDVHTRAFYDRFDNYPNAWDASPSARYVRDMYPTGWPVFEGDEPAVVVGGDPTKKYPFTAFGTPYDGVYDEYRSPFTYSY
mmetsp:Transcript_69745/g.145419  ORF Transcript_69745/g.145419 Transcript_69745/m.145419 type:complete len:172 (+) Transcript_69745:29-544(+)